jgi:hypothetical protein
MDPSLKVAKSNGHIACDACREEIVGGHRDNIRAGYGTNVKEYRGYGMTQTYNFCARHRTDHYLFPEGAGFSGAI